MNLLSQNNFHHKDTLCASGEAMDKRWSRDIQEDLKIGIDEMYHFKSQLDDLHPLAKESLLRLMQGNY